MKTIKTILTLSVAACLFSTCKKDSAQKSNPSTAEYYFKGSLNGTATDWEATTNGTGWVAGSSASLSNDEGDISGGITALLTNFPAKKQVFGIEFKTIDKGPDDDDATVFNSFVTTGALPYSSTFDYIKNSKSIVIYYTDSSGNEYTSVGSQSGSTANVVSVTKVTGDDYNSDPGLKIKMTFSCILYPLSGTGSSIKITNAEATVFLDNLIDY